MTSKRAPFDEMAPSSACGAPRCGSKWRGARMLAVALILSACGEKDVVVADLIEGSLPSSTELAAFGAPVLIEGLLEPSDEIADPTLSADLKTLYFSSPKSGNWDIWMSERQQVSAPWSPATIVAELAVETYEAEPSLSGDGLTLWFSSNRPQSANVNHIWVARRATRSDPWGAPEQLNFGTSRSERGPSTDFTGSTLVFYSATDATDSDLYLTTRESPADDWSAPRALSEINSRGIDWDPGVYANGRALVYGTSPDGQSSPDLYETLRASSSAAFPAPTPRRELNSLGAEGDPWLSNDGRYIVFASDRNGISQLYEARR